MTEEKDWLAELVAVMARLRGENGCPWDREQTHETLKKYLVEEASELLDAIDDGNQTEIVDELGDVLLQVAFHCQIAAEDCRFDLQDVAENLCRKLIRRHPHVFGKAEVEDADGVVRQWDAIKADESGREAPESLLGSVPRHLPALAQAEKIQKRAAKVGFDWDRIEDVIDKVEEELDEIKTAIQAGDEKAAASEMGDLLFAAVNLSRYIDTDPEDALRQTNRKFRRRFAHVEKRVAGSGKGFTDHTLAELDAYWEEAKQAEPQQSLD